MVGSVDSLDLTTRSGFILDKKGNFTVFAHPDAISSTEPRGVNNKGLITGFRDRPYPLGGNTIFAFVYDPKNDTYTDVIPESDHDQSIAQGINSKGEVVGSAFFLDALDPCNPGNIGYSRYGWLRTKDGTVTYFQVNGNRTAPRGIDNSGTIVGFAIDPFDGKTKGFKVDLDGSQCQSITVATNDLIEPFGAEATFPQAIKNSGAIVGSYNSATNSHGFIATP